MCPRCLSHLLELPVGMTMGVSLPITDNPLLAVGYGQMRETSDMLVSKIIGFSHLRFLLFFFSPVSGYLSGEECTKYPRSIFARTCPLILTGHQPEVTGHSANAARKFSPIEPSASAGVAR